jgi:PPP family 3-phenylpropionic acid transporter
MSFPGSLALPARLASFYFAYFAYVAAFVAYFPVYLAWEGLDAGEIAFVLALPQLARVFAPGLWGWLADHWGAKTAGAQRGIVIFSCAAMTFCFAALPYASGTRTIGLLIAFAGVLSAGALPLVEAITLGSLATEPARYGPIRLWGSVSFMAVVLAGGIWLDFHSVATLPTALTLSALACAGASLLLPRSAAPAPRQARRFSIPPGAGAILAAGFCMALAHGALYAFFTLHLQREGYSGTAIGFLWTLGVIAEILVFAYLPALFRRYSLSAILIASFLCAAVRFLAIGWASSLLWILAAAQLLHAATFGSFHAASLAVVHRLFPPEAQARGQALFSSVAYGAGGAAGALLAGWAWQISGPALAFSLAALAGLLGAYFAYLLKRAGL